MGLVAAVGTAVTAAVTSLGVAVTATALTVGFETIAAVGVGLSVIGTVTHDKALSYVGTGLALVGGIGAVASSAGVIGSDAASGGSLYGPSAAASTADAGTAVSSDTVDALAGNVGDDLSTAAGGGFGADALGGNVGDDLATAAGGDLAGEPAAASGAAADLTPPPGDGTFVGASQDAPTAGAATANGPAGQVAPATATAAPTPNLSLPPTALTPAAGTINGGNGVLPGDVSATTGAAVDGGAATAAGSSGGVLQSILDFTKANPLLSYGVLQAGGSLISGLTSTLTPAQVSALNAQAASNQAAANLTTQQTANLAQPRSTASLAPVTGTPNTIITPPNAGIINGAPSVNITGTPT